MDGNGSALGRLSSLSVGEVEILEEYFGSLSSQGLARTGFAMQQRQWKAQAQGDQATADNLRLRLLVVQSIMLRIDD